MSKTNPNGANQFQPDPRQSLFLKNYLDPESETFSNAYKSALAAKYEEEYAKNLMNAMPKWLSENIEDADLVGKAMENLKKFLDDDKEKKIQSDMTKFTLERLYKKKYSPRQEIEARVEVGEIDDKEFTDIIKKVSNESQSEEKNTSIKEDI